MLLLCLAAFLLREKSNGGFWNGGYVFVDSSWMRSAWCANARSVVLSVCVCNVFLCMLYVLCVCGFGMKPLCVCCVSVIRVVDIQGDINIVYRIV